MGTANFFGARFLSIGTEKVIRHGVDPSECEKVSENNEFVVVKIPSQTINPGSRYSGLKSYYSPEIQVYKKVRQKENGTWEVEPIISWEVKRKKK